MAEELYTAIVSADNGKPVNLRASADANGKLIKKVPVGTVANVLEEADDEWAGVRIGSTQGYMMRKFLKAENANNASAANDEAFDKLMQAQQLLTEVISLLGGAVG